MGNRPKDTGKILTEELSPRLEQLKTFSEIGALGGGFIPNAMGLSKQYTGSFSTGFIAFAIFACGAFLILRIAQRNWTRSWVGKGGKALSEVHHIHANAAYDEKSA